MEKQMDMVTLMRRLRAHGFALSMLFDKKTLKMISDKSVGKPCEPDPEVCTNLWGTYDMFTGAEKGVIAEAEMEHTEGNSVLLGKSSFGPHNARAQKALMLAASLSGRNMVEHQGGYGNTFEPGVETSNNKQTIKLSLPLRDEPLRQTIADDVQLNEDYNPMVDNDQPPDILQKSKDDR